jgi:hypothetical protein
MWDLDAAFAAEAQNRKRVLAVKSTMERQRIGQSDPITHASPVTKSGSTYRNSKSGLIAYLKRYDRRLN